MSDINNFRSNLLLKCKKIGLVEFKDYCIELIAGLEKRGKEYNQLRGELAEVLLEALLQDFCDILESQGIHANLIKNLPLIKRSNGKLYSSEIDVCLLTEYRCYLFEVKSYKGKKTLTDECLLHGYKDMNIYTQSKMHLDFFNECFGECRLKYTDRRELITPFKLVFFEFSHHGVKDLRNNEWKDRVKLLTYENFYNFFIDEYNNWKYPQWNLDKAMKTMIKLDKNRDMIMKYHIERLT